MLQFWVPETEMLTEGPLEKNLPLSSLGATSRDRVSFSAKCAVNLRSDM